MRQLDRLSFTVSGRALRAIHHEELIARCLVEVSATLINGLMELLRRQQMTLEQRHAHIRLRSELFLTILR